MLETKIGRVNGVRPPSSSSLLETVVLLERETLGISNLSEAATHIFKKCAELLDVPHFCFHRFEKSTNSLKIVSSYSSPHVPEFRPPRQLSVDDSPQGHLLSRQKENLNIKELGADPRWRHNPLLRSSGMKSGLFVVVPGTSGPLGVLTILSPHPREFQSDEAHYLKIAASLLSRCYEQTQFQETLRHKDRELGRLFDAAPVGLQWLDDTGRILSANQTQLRFLDYSLEEYLGRSFTDFFAEMQNAADFFSQWKSGQDLSNFEIKLRRQNGAIKNLLLDSRNFGSEEAPHQRLVFCRDITRLRQQELDILSISEREQQRISQELHDGLCFKLLGLKFTAAQWEASLKEGAGGSEDSQDSLEAQVNQILEATRQIARGMHPKHLESQGLSAALRDLSENIETLFEISCVCQMETLQDKPPPEVATNLYRIAQEAVMNAIKHGQADRIIIGLHQKSNQLSLTVKNNGTPFNPGEPSAEGMGLRIMKYRANAIGASLQIKHSRSAGTVLSCTVHVP